MPVATKPERWILHPPKVRTLKDSFRRCKQIARKHYENFPVGSVLIPREMQPYVFAVYAFARTADDFADEPGYSDAERILYLNEWEDLFHRSLEIKTGHPIMWAVSETIRAKDIPPKFFTDLLSAFRQDVVVRRYNTFEDVMDYCSRSANPVGRILLLIFGYRDPALASYSDSICSALQLTNFWQDVSVDLKKDRVYIPLEDLETFGVRENDLVQRICTEEFRKLIRFEVERTGTMFSTGMPLLQHLRGRFKQEIKCILIGGTSVLEKIERQRYDVLTRRPKLGVGDVPRFLKKFLFTF